MKAQRALLLALAAWTALATALSCGSDGLVGGSCLPGLDACGTSCVNLGSDVTNCGRCGSVCSPGQQCIVGVCLGPGVSLEYDGGTGGAGVLLPDGAVLLPDGAVVSGGGSSSGSGGNDCIPPFDTPERCGSCERVCPSDAPFCEGNDAVGYDCVNSCSSERAACGSQCVDTATNPDHCGTCYNRCASAICRDSACVGAAAGHVVLMCMNLESGRANSPQTVLMSNALLLAKADPVRVLGYTRYASAAVLSGAQRTLAWVDRASARRLELTLTGAEGDVARLDREQYDALLVLDQTDAPVGALANIGAGWRERLQSFTADGGVVIVLASTQGTGEMHDLIAQAALLDPIPGLANTTGVDLYNRAPSDAVGASVLSQFLALPSSCTFQTSPAPDVNTVFVVTDTPASADGPGSPVVIHRVQTNE